MKTGNSRARCFNYEDEERPDNEVEKMKASYINDEQNKVQQRISKKNESEKNKATNDKKKAIKNDSDNDEDRQNWFYTADEVYPDAPFRIQDYKKK